MLLFIVLKTVSQDGCDKFTTTSVDGVFDTIEKADEYIEKHIKPRTYSKYEYITEYSIEECTLNAS